MYGAARLLARRAGKDADATSGCANSWFLACGKAQTDVVGGPLALGAELGAEDFLDFGEVRGAFAGWQSCGEILGKRFQPRGYVTRQRSGTGDQRDVAEGEAAFGKARRIIFDGGEIPRVRGLAIQAPAIQSLDKRPFDFFDAAHAAHFGYEASARAEGAPHAVEHGIWIAHPVKGCVAENGIELHVER